MEILSTITIKGMSGEGLPEGTKWDMKDLKFKNKPKATPEDHTTTLKEMLRASCLVGVKEWGMRPK